MNQKIIFTIGIPASGKTTWKNEYMKQNKNFVSIERDDIRMKIFGEEMCSFADEQIITSMCDELAFIALGNKKSIIFSNTNLNSSNLVKEIEKYNKFADIEFIIFDISLEESIKRNSKRDRKVPVEVIKKMHVSFEKFKKEIYNTEISKKWNIMGVFEDRQKVVNMWRQLGVKCFQVEKNI